MEIVDFVLKMVDLSIYESFFELGHPRHGGTPCAMDSLEQRRLALRAALRKAGDCCAEELRKP